MPSDAPEVLEGQVVADEPKALATVPRKFTGLTPVFDIALAKKRLAEFQEFVKEYLVPDEDYGQIPGTPKPTLYKSGADKLCELYGLADSYEFATKTEAWDREPPLFDYTILCKLTHIQSGALVASGLGSCSSYEGKYRYRDLKRKCPSCGKDTIIKGRAEFSKGQAGYEDGGWVCWKKEGKSDGCGAKFAEADEAVASQIVGKIENDDLATLKNTVLKMAKKRAKVDATLAATRSSGIFTQDVEDMGDLPQGSKAAAQAVGERKIAEHKAKQAEAKVAAADTAAKTLPVGQGIITKVVKAETHAKPGKPSRPYWEVWQNGNRLSSFDNILLSESGDYEFRLWAIFEEKVVGEEADFIVESKPGPSGITYHNIVAVKRIADRRYDVAPTSGGRYTHSPYTDRSAYKATDEDLPEMFK